MACTLLFALSSAASDGAAPGTTPTVDVAGAPVAVAEGAPPRRHRDLDLDPRVAERLSDDQLFELIKAKSQGQEPPAVAIVVPVAMFLTILLGIWLSLAHQARKEAVRHETLRLMLEKGVPIPPELLNPPLRRSDLRKGIVLLSGGAGIAAMLGLLERQEPAWAIGLLPALIGVGYLIAWRLERRPGPVSG